MSWHYERRVGTKKEKKSEKRTISAWKWGRVRAARSKWGEEDVAFESLEA